MHFLLDFNEFQEINMNEENDNDVTMNFLFTIMDYLVIGCTVECAVILKSSLEVRKLFNGYEHL